MKRLFVAINLPVDIKNKIDEAIRKLQGHKDIRFIQPENWHLTICFLGYQPDEAINPILESIKEIIRNEAGPAIEFEKIILAPPGRTPRMIWLTGTKETSRKLDEIKNHLENKLIESGVKFQPENRPYNAHLTLARFQPAQINVDTISINQFLNQHKSALTFQANSIDLMESHLKRTGAEYEILTNLAFLNK